MSDPFILFQKMQINLWWQKADVWLPQDQSKGVERNGKEGFKKEACGNFLA